MKTILFVCSGNTCRSPMAQALLLKYLHEHQDIYQPDAYQVWSAGMHTRDGLPASDEAIRVMSAEKVDLKGHCSSRLDKSLVQQADYIFTMTVSQRDYLKQSFPAKDNIFVIKEFAAGIAEDITDPYGAGYEVYYECLTELKKIIPGIAARIKKLEEEN